MGHSHSTIGSITLSYGVKVIWLLGQGHTDVGLMSFSYCFKNIQLIVQGQLKVIVRIQQIKVLLQENQESLCQSYWQC